MTVTETKNRIETELAEIASGFGNACSRVTYQVQVEENEIEGASTDITAIFGSLIIAKEGATEDEKLYLPLDAELDDDDTVDEERFEKNLNNFKNRVLPIRERLATADDVDLEIEKVIQEFDNDMDTRYHQELERLNRTAKRNLIMAILGAVGMFILAAIVIAADKYI